MVGSGGGVAVGGGGVVVGGGGGGGGFSFGPKLSESRAVLVGSELAWADWVACDAQVIGSLAARCTLRRLV